MRLSITRVLTPSAILVILLSLRVTRASPKWRPTVLSNRMSSGSTTLSGCWTPKGRMELGQRVYPGGCSRIVCKIILGRPIIEHQFCEKIKVPKHCIVQDRSWKRYPDCCPEVVCPPANQGYQGRLDTRLYQQGSAVPGFYPPSSIPESYANGNGGLFHDVASSQNQRHFDTNDFFATQQPMQRATDVVYGKGFSIPHVETTSVKVSRDPQLIFIEDNRYPADFWEPKELHYLVSPTNGLDLFGPDYQEDVDNQDIWNTGLDSGEQNEYADFWETSTTGSAKATPFVISHQHSPVDDLTKSSYSFYKDANEVKTSPLPYREQSFATPTVIEHQNVPETRRPGRIHYKEKQTAKSEYIRTTETTEVPFVRPTTYALHTNLENGYKTTIPLHQLRTKSFLPVSSIPITTKTASVTTEEPTTMEMKISTFSTTVTPKTIKQEIPTTSKKDLFFTSDKNLKDSFYQSGMQSAIEEDISNKTKSPSKMFTRLPPVRKPTTTPFERITKRVRPSSAPKKRFRVRKTTLAPTTSSSYEFVPPDLDPQEHDLVEFIHTPLDPSALIPGHDEYLQSKFDSAKEYSEKVNENNGESQRKKRSVPKDMKLKDEEKDERKRKPTFYIPWKNTLENPLSIDTKILTESQSIENSDPPTKFEQAANILKGLMIHPSLLAGVLTSKKYVPEPQESFKNKSLERGQFVMNEERSLKSDKINEEQNKQNATTSSSSNIVEEKSYDNDTISEEKAASEIENSDPDQTALARNQTETVNSFEDNNLGIDNNTIVPEKNSDDVQNLVSNSTSDPQAGTTMSNLVQPSIKEETESVPQMVDFSLGLEKDLPISSSPINNETFGSATKYYSIPLHVKENKTLEIALPIDQVSSKLLNSQIEDTNIVPNIQRVRVPVYKRGPDRQQNGTIMGIVSSTNYSEPNNESNSQNNRRLPWSPPPSRESQSNGFSSETVRTRIQVPFLNYERRNKSQFTSPPTKPKIITTNATESSSTTRAQYFESPIGNIQDIDFSEGLDIPYTVEETNDYTKKNSDSRSGIRTRKNDYYPRQRTVKDPSNSHLKIVDDSKLPRSRDRTLQLEHTRDIDSTSITDKDQSAFSKDSAGRELPEYFHDSHPTPDQRSSYGSLSRSFDNHSQLSLPPTVGETSHPFIQGFPSGRGRPFGGHEPGPITSSVTFSSPHVDLILSRYSKSFEDNFGKSQQDSSRHLDSTPLFPSPDESPFSLSLGTDDDHKVFDIPNYSKNPNYPSKGELIPGTSSKANPSSTETSTVSESEHISKPPSKNNTDLSDLGQTISSLFVPPNFTPKVEKSELLSLTTSFNFNPYSVPVTPPGSHEGVSLISSESLRGSIQKNGDPIASPIIEVKSLHPNKTLLNSSLKAQDTSKPVNSFRTKFQTQRAQLSFPQRQKSLTTSNQLEQLLDSPEIKTGSLNSSGNPVFLQTLPNQPKNQNLKNSTRDKSVESDTNLQSSGNNSAPQPEQGAHQAQHQSRNREIANQALRQRINRRGNSQSRNVPTSSTIVPVPSEYRRRNYSRQLQKSASNSTNLTNNNQRRIRNRQTVWPHSHPVSHQPTRTSRNQNPRVLQETLANESTSQRNHPAITHHNRKVSQEISATGSTATENQPARTHHRVTVSQKIPITGLSSAKNQPARTHNTHRVSQDILAIGSTATDNQSGKVHPNRRVLQEISATGSTATENQSSKVHLNRRVSQEISATGSTATENQPARTHINHRVSQGISATGLTATDNQPARKHHNHRISQEILATGSTATTNQPARTHHNHRVSQETFTARSTFTENQPARTLHSHKVSQKTSTTGSAFTDNQSARTHHIHRDPQNTLSVKLNSNEASSYSPGRTNLNTNPTSRLRPSSPSPSTVSPVSKNFAEENVSLNPADDSLILPGFWEPQKNVS